MKSSTTKRAALIISALMLVSLLSMTAFAAGKPVKNELQGGIKHSESLKANILPRRENIKTEVPPAHGHELGEGADAAPAYGHEYEEGADAAPAYGHENEEGADAAPVRSHKHGEGTNVAPVRNHEHSERANAAPAYGHENGEGADVAPAYGYEYEEGADMAPVRSHKHGEGDDIAPVRSHKHGEGDDAAPVRNHKHGEGDDAAPVRNHERGERANAAPGHSHEYGEGVYTAPGCGVDGFWTFTCGICGNSYIETDEGSAAEHDYVLIDHKDAVDSEDGYDYFECSLCGVGYTVAIPAVGTDAGNAVTNITPAAYVEKLNGNQNKLFITVALEYEDGATEDIKWDGLIGNNASGVFNVGDYKVYIDTKGNTQIRACYIVK